MTVSPQVGDPAPAFNLPTPDGPVSLADFKGRKLVLFFYPKAGTSGCTREAMDFSALEPQFRRAGVSVLGVSADPLKAQVAFRTKHALALALASDESHAMLQAYGVWGTKSMYGRTYQGITRTTVLIDPAGRIARIWPKVKIAGHAQEVLDAAAAL